MDLAQAIQMWTAGICTAGTFIYAYEGRTLRAIIFACVGATQAILAMTR